MNCRRRVCLSTPINTNHRYNYKTPDLFSLSRIFTDLIMHNYRSNQSALMTRCGTDFRHQYGIFGGESQTSVSRNATRPGAKKDGCFRRLFHCLFIYVPETSETFSDSAARVLCRTVSTFWVICCLCDLLVPGPKITYNYCLSRRF